MVASRSAAGRGQPGDLIDRVRAIQGAGQGSLRPSTGVVVPEVCPFMGQGRFGVGDAAYFFGRERPVADLASGLDRFVAIVGPSGSGKSSLLQAGLLAALAAGLLPGSADWHQVLIRPGERPMARLRAALGLAADEPIRAGSGERLLLAVDQLEEVFGGGGSGREREEFLAALADLATAPSGRAAVVVAVRADCCERFADHPALAGLIAQHQVRLGPMSASELRRAVELPAARAGLEVEPELVEALIEDAAGAPGALPLLSTTLAELWRRRSDSTLTLAGYRAAGGLGGAAARLAETTYLGIPEGRRPLVRTIVLRLVTQGAEGAAVPRAAPIATFDRPHNPDSAAVLAALAQGRVVTLSEREVELAHPGLLLAWPRLREWIEAESLALRRRAAITRAAQEWDAGGRDPADLDRGTRLATALEYGADHELSGLEREFVEAGRAAAETQKRRVHLGRRTLGGLLTGMVVLLAAALVAGMLALQQHQRAEQAQTGRLAHGLAAAALVEEQLDLSLLLARQAVALQDTPQTRGYLLEVLLRHPAAIGAMRTSSGPGARQTLAISPDGTTLAVADSQAGLFFFDANTFDPIGEPLDIALIYTLAFSPDGRTLAYAARASVDQLGLVDASSHDRLETANAGSPTRIAFTPDGSKLALIHTEPARGERVRRWLSIRDAHTLTRIYRPTSGLGFVDDESAGQPALTQDGRSLLTFANGALTLWDVEARQAVWTVPTDAVRVNVLAVSPDKASVALGFDDRIRVIDVATTRTRETRVPGTPLAQLVFSPDGATLAATSSDGSVSLWDSESLTPTTVLWADSAPLGTPAFSPDGRTVYTPGSDGTAVAWDAVGNRGVRARIQFAADRQPGTYPGRFSPDGGLIAVAPAGAGIGLWDADELMPSGAPLLPPGGQVNGFAFSADGRRLAAVTSEGLTIWDLASRSLLQSRRTSAWADGPVDVAFGPDGDIAVASRRGLQLFDVATGAETGNLLGAQQVSGSLAFSPTSPVLAFTAFTVWPGDTGRVQVVDFDQRTLLRELDSGARGVEAVVFSPDGRWLAASYADPMVQIWDAGTWEPVRQLRPASAIAAMDFSADASVLAIADQQGRVAMWDVASGSPQGVSLDLDAGSPTIDFSPDGLRLLATTGRGTATVWDVDPRSWAQRACAVANRALTQQEWDRYLAERPFDPACAG